MHILFLTDNFPPEVNAPASRTFEHCREWVRAGHRVTAITCAPNFPKGRVFKGYANRAWQTEEMDGICVIRVWSYITRNEGLAKRVLDYTSYMVSAFMASFFVRRVDVIVGTSPQFFTACAAYAVSAFRRRPWVFELRDLWPASIRAVGAMPDSPILRFLEKVELFLYRRAHVVVSVTPGLKNSLVDRGIDGSKIHVVTNGVDLQHFTAQPKDPLLLRKLKLNDSFVVGYIGTHGMAHALDTLLDAASLLRDTPAGTNVKWLLLGDGAERTALVKRAELEGLHNVRFVATVPKDEVPRYWSLLDASVIHLKRTPLFRTAIPSKLFECMAMRIPVLLGVEGESDGIVRRERVGIPFEPENPRALASAVLRLIDDSNLCSALGDAGGAAAERYDRRRLAQNMLAVLKELAPDTAVANPD